MIKVKLSSLLKALRSKSDQTLKRNWKWGKNRCWWIKPIN